MLELNLSDRLSAPLAAGARAAADFTVPMAAIADLMRSDTVLNFESERAPDGTPWLPSARARETGGLTLTDTGHLRQSIVAASDDSSAIIGTNLVYAAIHQFGGQFATKSARAQSSAIGPFAAGMPARPFIGFGPGLIQDIEALLAAHLAAPLGGAAS